jgi:serine palmitoyltransferase
MAQKALPQDEIPLWTLIWTYQAFILGILLAHFRNFTSWLSVATGRSEEDPAFVCQEGHAPLLKAKEYFYTRYFFGRLRDCWDRPICSRPGAMFDLIGREFDGSLYGSFQYTGEKMRAINLGSYNYLGFAENAGKCIDDTIDAVHKYGISTAGRRMETGSMDLHRKLELRMADFLGKEDAIIFNMGYATNSTSISALIGKGGLIISDSLNHASIVTGCRSTGAKIKVFQHNDPADLERVLRQSIAEGQPRTHRDWTKIIIVVEGIYSMEGEILRLPEIVAIKKKYKAYLYVDEAHSIGALGKSARGVCDYWGVPTSDVDILMGTFTKSFGSVGGYIAASKDVVRHLRQHSLGSVYQSGMSLPCVQMILSALDVITGADGTDDGQRRINALRENGNFFRQRLKEMGFRIIGSEDSPVIPLMLFHPAKIAGFSRAALEENLAVVVVGFPATSLLGSRARFCVSAGHTKEQLERALESISVIGDRLMLKYGNEEEAAH